jgi:hypothetical protein
MGSEIVAPDGGMTCREVVPRENSGEVDDVLETDEEEPNGLLGRDEGSVLSQAFIVNRINNANP